MEENTRITSFGIWLGESNGKEMLASVFADCTIDQARAAITTFCKLFGILVDTADWDNLIDWTHKYYNSWTDDRESLDNYMCGLLI